MKLIIRIKQIILHVFYKLVPDKRIKFLQEEGMIIGQECTIFPSVSFGSEPYLISIGNKVKITDGVRFVTHDGGMHVLRNLKLLPNADKFKRIEVSDNVFIGINSIILPGVKIGENCVIGAGSVVTHDIPSNNVAAGVPAKVLYSIEEYYKRNIDVTEETKGMSPNKKKNYLLEKGY